MLHTVFVPTHIKCDSILILIRHATTETVRVVVRPHSIRIPTPAIHSYTYDDVAKVHDTHKYQLISCRILIFSV